MKQSKSSQHNNAGLHLLLLVVWLILGVALRFANLGGKPASSIEIATIGFSLGHGFSQIPLDEVIDIATILSPLRLDSTISPDNVLHRLITESTHPPLYFWLTYWWTKLFTENGELVSLTVGRSLSAILGSFAIPAIFAMSWVTFCSNRYKLVAHLAAVLMAVSPYGIYLAQEARHYTLTILWIIASLSCLMVATRCLKKGISLPIWVSCFWVVVNSLGIATHYFFALALGAEALTIVWLLFWDFSGRAEKQFSFSYWWRIGAVGCGTFVGCLVWLPVAGGISSNELTSWIQTSYELDQIWQPIPRLMAWLITMVMLLPIEGIPTGGVVISVIVVLLVLIWLIPALIRGIQSSLDSKFDQVFRLSLQVLIGYGLGAIIIFLLVIYGLGKDVSLAARYHFVYFPVVLVLMAIALANLWQSSPDRVSTDVKSDAKLDVNFKCYWYYASGKKVAIVMVLMGLIGSLTVINNYGFQKSRSANRLANHILTTSVVTTIVATTYETSSQLRELIALALSFQGVNSQSQSLSDQQATPRFLLVRSATEEPEVDSWNTFREILRSQPKPLDLWGINLTVDSDDLTQLNCLKDNKLKLSNSGYKNRLYHCS